MTIMFKIGHQGKANKSSNLYRVILYKRPCEALDTQDPIWIVLRSFYSIAGTGVDCVYDKVTSNSGNEYQLEHGYRYEGHVKKGTLLGTAGQKGTESYLDVRETEGHGKNRHFLKYWNKDKKCFILSFQNRTSGQTQCQLHLWAQSVSTTSGFSCEEKYDVICGETKHKVYTSDCPTPQ
uniref:Putative licpodalin-4 1 n=1 Tax=Amblyomma triste TaxID=251400 RepID=A0A023G642_AMBTT